MTILKMVKSSAAGLVAQTVAILASASTVHAYPGGPNWAQEDFKTIERLTGAGGDLDVSEGVFKVSAPRSDLKLTIGGVKMTPPLGLTSWAAFKRVGDKTMVMGDLVLREDQVNPVMDVALANGLDVTALHNHFFWDEPKVMFMHIGGMGDEHRLAEAVGKALARIQESAAQLVRVPTASIDPEWCSCTTGASAPRAISPAGSAARWI